ncbi:hypothetical protein Mal4_09850 [Maioricimonas rarisocia]|uniref:Uncharacterized protein n=1 Tax=Maioricimonas rarisocia TaxID=2528026 RepID=A0A517Z2K6_9PLAN|nr:hypothetical protein [Maioricimonas rarisocia]QDU36697.1 hypothetical protein Mal4_09850 [Maioricimonas rarisocia]
MKHIALLLAAFVIASPAFSEPSAVGQSVSMQEADQLLGQCGDYGRYATWVCYGGNCMSGGCGCAHIQQIVAGPHKIADASPCASSYYCTAPLYLLPQQCGY